MERSSKSRCFSALVASVPSDLSRSISAMRAPASKVMSAPPEDIASILLRASSRESVPSARSKMSTLLRSGADSSISRNWATDSAPVASRASCTVRSLMPSSAARSSPMLERPVALRASAMVLSSAASIAALKAWASGKPVASRAKARVLPSATSSILSIPSAAGSPTALRRTSALVAWAMASSCWRA